MGRTEQLRQTISTRTLLWIVLLTAVVVNYVTTPLGADVQVNVAFAQQADLNGTFPSNVLETWTLRGVGYKFLVYVLYDLTVALVGYEDKTAFAVCFKSLYTVAVLGFLGMSTSVARETLEEWGVGRTDAFFIGSIAFLSTSQIVSFQAEELAALFVVVSTAFILSERQLLEYTGAAALGLLFTLKGITLLVGPVPIAILLFVEGGATRRLVRIAVTAMLSAVIVPLAVLLVFPEEVAALLEATVFQATLRKSPLKRVFAAGGTFVLSFHHLPVILPGFLLGVGTLHRAVASRRWLMAGVLAAIAGIPFATVVIQGAGGAWYGYHLAVLLPTVVFLFIGLFSVLGRANLNVPTISGRGINRTGVILTLGLCWLVMTSPVAAFDGGSGAYADSIPSSSAAYRDVVDRERTVYAGIESEFELTAREEILYLSDGVPTYYLESKSHLRYYYPLPLQRVVRNPDLRDSEVYRETMRAVLEYDGRVIVHHHQWMELSNYPPLEEKIEREYCIAYRDNTTVQPVTVWIRKNEPVC